MKNTISKKQVLLGFLGFLFCISLIAGKTKVVSAAEYICPDSDTRYLSEEEVADLTLQEANYAKNEIYARHGYLFKSKELTEYFSQFSWYKGTTTGDKFSESVFNKYENSNLSRISEYEHKLAPEGYTLNAAGYDIYAVRSFVSYDYTPVDITQDIIDSMRSGKVEKLGPAINLDLDQDGFDEEIALIYDDSKSEYYGPYTIKINEQRMGGQAESIHRELYGVCLGSDQIYLIVAQDGPSDDPVAEFYTWKDQEIVYAGEIYVWINGITTDENGIVMGWQRCNAMDTNSMYGQWEIGLDDQLYLAGDGKYEMYRKDYQLKKSIRVYESNSRKSRSRVLDPQDISVMYTDGYDWVYIKAANGKWGWYESGALSYEEKNNTFGGMRYAG